MIRKILTFLVSATLITACDVPEEACNCSKSEPPPVTVKNADFGDDCESDDDCVSDEENLVCSSNRCTVECYSEYPACSIYNYSRNGILLREYACEANSDGQDVCVEV